MLDLHAHRIFLSSQDADASAAEMRFPVYGIKEPWEKVQAGLVVGAWRRAVGYLHSSSAVFPTHLHNIGANGEYFHHYCSQKSASKRGHLEVLDLKR